MNLGELSDMASTALKHLQRPYPLLSGGSMRIDGWILIIRGDMPLQSCILGQQPLEVEMHGVLVGFGLQRLLIGHHERAQTLHHLRENVRGNDTIAQHVLSPPCPHGCHLFASSHCPVDPGCCLEAIVITICYGM